MIKKIKVLFLDIYPDSRFRVSKDTNGGYGTVNNYGSGMVSNFLSMMVSREVDWPPLDLMYVAAIVRDSGAEVEYSRDQDIDLKMFNYVVMSSSIVAHESELKVLKKLVSRGVKVCVIGAFATSYPQPYLEVGGVVVVGEPESYFMKNNISTLFEIEERVVHKNERADVDTLPFPALDLFLKNNELKFGLLNKAAKMVPILATRGCPYKCYEYCTYPIQQGRRIRGRDPTLIIDEMDYWADNYDINLFVFRDPVFSLNRVHTVNLCNEILSRNRKYQFIIETHLKNIDEELLCMLVTAGLVMIKVGVESVDSNVLSSNNRYSLQCDEQENLIRKIEKTGVQVVTHYIIGMPGETVKSYNKTLSYAMRLNTLFAQISVFTPYPGTPVYKEYKNKIIVNNFEEYTQFKLIFKHENFTVKDVENMLSSAYRMYYFRFSWLIKYIRFKLKEQ